jgi:hypothetical protein
MKIMTGKNIEGTLVNGVFKYAPMHKPYDASTDSFRMSTSLIYKLMINGCTRIQVSYAGENFEIMLKRYIEAGKLLILETGERKYLLVGTPKKAFTYMGGTNRQTTLSA